MLQTVWPLIHLITSKMSFVCAFFLYTSSHFISSQIPDLSSHIFGDRAWERSYFKPSFLLLSVSLFPQHLSSLTELYASSNLISTTRELFHLKPLPHLAVLDLSQNPLTTLCENYRAFAVYHLAPLKSLDGLPIVSVLDLGCQIAM